MRITAPGSIIAAGLVLTVVLTAGRTARAQPPGGFGARMMMDRLDENDDGRLDSDELSQSRFPLKDMAERAGIDTSRGLDEDDVEKVFENMREQRGERGRRGGDRGGRGGFDRGGSDRGERGDNRSDRDKAPEPPPRVTVDLQATYAPGDTNGDGQLELSEWLRWKSRAALREFLALDRNHDGILTPRELAQSGSPLPVDLARLLPGVHPTALHPAGGSFAASNPTMSGAPALAASPMAASTAAGAPPAARSATSTTATSTTSTSTAAQSPSAAETTSPVSAAASADLERLTATAHRQFRILDRDRDGTLTDLEWQRSSRLRPKFEAAGADLSQSMSEEQFLRIYLKISTSQ